MTKAGWIVLGASLLVGCGGKTDDPSGAGGGAGSGATGGSGASGGTGATGGGVTGGSGGGGAGGAGGGVTGGTGGLGGVPNECAVPVTESGPYPLKIRFVNPTAQARFIRQDCQLNWTLFACADGYTQALSHSADCTIDCAEKDLGCIACGACMLNAIEVTPQKPAEADWSGIAYTFAQTQSGCQCHSSIPAPAAKYAIEVPVYLSEQDALSSTPAYVVKKAFELPSPTGSVDIELVLTN